MNKIHMKSLIRFWRHWVWPILVAVLLATSFKSAIADWNVVPTGSMNPTIVEGDRIFVNKLAYDLKVPYTTWRLAAWQRPQRGDVVVFYSPENGQRLVKRVIGIPGDKVAMHNNRLFINGKGVNYDVLPQPEEKLRALDFEEKIKGRPHAVRIHPGHPSAHTFETVHVPENHYFMLGDNRDISADSRYFGFVHGRLIMGRATAIVASLDIQNHYRPRWERFFSKLN